jgi:hypothetical protein
LANLTALEETIRLVKPASVSFNAFMKARGLNLSARTLGKAYKALELRQTIKYKAALSQYQYNFLTRMPGWLADRHPDVSTQREIQALIPDYTRYYRANYGEAPQYDRWLRNEPSVSLYSNWTKITLADPPQAPSFRLTYDF